MSEIALSLRNLTRSYHQGALVIDVLRGVDFDLAAGEIVALLGPSGTGKSTLLQAAGQLEGGYGGDVVIGGKSCARLKDDGRTELRRQSIGFVYQFHHLLPDFTALENVMMPLRINGEIRNEAKQKASDILNRLGLGARLHHRPSELSGGEQQRVAISRALVHRPAVLLADEPTGNLDETTSAIVFDELLDLTRAHQTAALIATHNEALAAKMDRIVRLHDGKIVEA